MAVVEEDAEVPVAEELAVVEAAEVLEVASVVEELVELQMLLETPLMHSAEATQTHSVATLEEELLSVVTPELVPLAAEDSAAVVLEPSVVELAETTTPMLSTVRSTRDQRNDCRQEKERYTTIFVVLACVDIQNSSPFFSIRIFEILVILSF